MATITIENLQARASENLVTRQRIAYACNFIKDEAEKAANWASRPRPEAGHADLLVEAIVPQNRTMQRRTHFRFIYRISGKIVREAEAHIYLRGCQGG